MTGSVRLFSYGTLRLREVQLANYGRELECEPDVLLRHRIEPIEIDDPEVVRISGRALHTIARATGNAGDRIEGVVLLLTEEELAATDGYETDAYSRVEVTLESGRTAWVYVAAGR